jgi:hypothetical protein
MTMKPADDLEAVRQIAAALDPFEPKDQERILRWAREKIGLKSFEDARDSHTPSLTDGSGGSRSPAGNVPHPKDIRSFIDSKNPQSDNQFAAAVAYYYRFEAPEAERKMDITADDVQDATRKAGRDRLTKPGQTLLNAHGQGYFDKTERGRYAISTVGENLVAMALPQGATTSARPKAKRRSATRKKRRSAKK